MTFYLQIRPLSQIFAISRWLNVWYGCAKDSNSPHLLTNQHVDVRSLQQSGIQNEPDWIPHKLLVGIFSSPSPHPNHLVGIFY